MTDVASVLEKPRKSRASREEGVMPLSGCDHERATVGCGTCPRSSPHSLRENIDVLFVIWNIWDVTGAVSFIQKGDLQACRVFLFGD